MGEGGGEGREEGGELNGPEQSKCKRIALSQSQLLLITELTEMQVRTRDNIAFRNMPKDPQGNGPV